LIAETQHGFRKGGSCLSNILTFLDQVTRYVDDGEAVDVVYLDFAKAFDKVPHKLLIIKLEAHGITGKVVRWMEKWLSGRRQRVCISGTFSDWKPVTSGVPHGSVLGPFLFLIFINDLDSKILSKILKFADDTKLFDKANMAADRECLQKGLNTLFKWSEIWQMSFNIDKCKVRHLGGRNCMHSYQLDGKDLKWWMKKRI